ncbi:MAG: rod shape-determining protein MreC [Candidatus Metalachnospira sp.]|nr:rod shape-determining protein MreC [Candidatus Metalachnospira sp.]
MKFINEYKKQLMILAVIALMIISFFTAGRKINAGFVDDILGFVVTPFQGAVTSVTNWVGGTIDEITEKNNLTEENEDLKRQVEELTAENERLSLYEDENERLSDLLEVSQKYQNYDTTGVRVIAKDTGVWYNSFLINKGENDDLETNMTVIDAGGLVGRVVKTGATYSKVYSILDSRSSVSVKSLRTDDLGVVVGDHDLMGDGLCKMEYIDSDAEIVEGDEIVTSGLSDYYPEGISVGYVKEIHQDENGLTKYAVIEPKVDFKHLDTLIVIKDLQNKPPDAEVD